MNWQRNRGARAAATVLVALVALAAGGTGARAQAPASAPRAMTLDEVVSAALEHSPQIVQSQGSVRTAAAGEKAARGAYLPTLSVSTGAALNGSDRTAGLGTTRTAVPADATSLFTPSSSYTADVSAQYSIFDGGKRSAELTRSRAQAAQADAGLVGQRNAVAFAARSGFFDVLRAGELAKAAEAEAQRAGDALTAAQKRLSAGAATRSDVLRAQLAVTQAQQSLSQARSQETTAQYALGRTVGYDGAISAASTSPAELAVRPLALTVTQLDSLVTRQAPVVRAGEAALQASSAQIGAAKADYLPKLGVSAGYDWANQGSTALNADNSWALRATISLPVFDGFQRDQAVTEARVATDEAAANLDDTRRAQRVELQKDVAALTDAQNQITLGQQAVQSAQEDLRVQQERYKLGASTMLDVVTSQSALAQAEQKLVNARYDYAEARAAVEALAGRAL